MLRVRIGEGTEAPGHPSSIESREREGVRGECGRPDSEYDRGEVTEPTFCAKWQLGEQSEIWEEPGAELLVEGGPIERLGGRAARAYAKVVGYRVGFTDVGYRISVAISSAYCSPRTITDIDYASFEVCC